MKAFLEMYNNLHSDNLHILRDLYREDIQFIDPAHEIHGIENLLAYFATLYQNVASISFTFLEPLMVDQKGYVRWEMSFSHKRLAQGRPILIEGMTYLEADEAGMIYYHRDYFDLGAMVYEHIPLLGRLVTSTKRRLGR